MTATRHTLPTAPTMRAKDVFMAHSFKAIAAPFVAAGGALIHIDGYYSSQEMPNCDSASSR